MCRLNLTVGSLDERPYFKILCIPSNQLFDGSSWSLLGFCSHLSWYQNIFWRRKKVSHRGFMSVTGLEDFPGSLSNLWLFIPITNHVNSPKILLSRISVICFISCISASQELPVLTFSNSLCTAYFHACIWEQAREFVCHILKCYWFLAWLGTWKLREQAQGSALGYPKSSAPYWPREDFNQVFPAPRPIT